MHKKNFSYPMHNFRAIAVLFVFLAHCNASMMHSNRIIDIYRTYVYECYILNYTIFGNGTLFFLFIAGYLSSHLFIKIRYFDFIKKKFYNIILPYICISIVIAAVSIIKYKITGVHFHSSPYIDSIVDLIYCILCGQVQMTYWYIPILLVLFVFTPLIINADSIVLQKVTLVALCLPVIYPFAYNPECFRYIYYYTFFAPIYLLGCLAGLKKDAFLRFINDYIYVIIVVFVMSTITLPYINYLYKGMYQDQIISYISKLSLALILHHSLARFNFTFTIIDIICNNSYTIYLIQYIIIDQIFFRLFNYLISIYDTYLYTNVYFHITTIFMITSLVCFVVTLLISIIMRHVFGRHSRKLIG